MGIVSQKRAWNEDGAEKMQKVVTELQKKAGNGDRASKQIQGTEMARKNRQGTNIVQQKKRKNGRYQ